MNILHVMGMRSTKFGGIERFLVELMEASPNDRFTFVYDTAPVSSVFVNKIKIGGGKIVVLNSSQWNAIRNIPAFIRLCRRVRPDVVHFHFENSYVYWAVIARMLGAKRIIKTQHSCLTTSHGEQAHHKSDMSKKQRLFTLNGFSLRFVDTVACVSQYTQRQFVEVYGETTERVKCIYLGTNTLVHTSSTDRMALCRQLNIPDGAKVVATTLFASPIKGADILIKAIPYVKSKNVVFMLIGLDEASTYTVSLHKLSEELGVGNQIRWIGITDNVATYLNIADLYVQPSRTEALGLAACEAMSLSLPVIASDVGGLPEIANSLFPVGDSQKLASAIDHILADYELRSAEGQKAKKRFEESLTYSASIHAYNRLYHYERNKNICYRSCL